MASLLLNWRLWAAVGLAALLFFLWSTIQAKKITIATLEGENAVLVQTNADLGAQLIGLQNMVATLKSNLDAAKKSIKDMQAIKDEANALRRRIIELQNQPGACEEIKVEYEKVASDITAMFNHRVRGKISVPGSGRDRTAPEVLPGPLAPDLGRSKVNAGTSG